MGAIRLRSGATIHVPTSPALLASRLPSFRDMRADLQRRTGHDLHVIDGFLDGRLTQIVQHIGDVYLQQLHAHIDHIQQLRDRVSAGIEAVVRNDGRLEGMSIADLQRSFAEMEVVLTELKSTERYIRELSEQRTRELFDGVHERPAHRDVIASISPTTLPPNIPPILAASVTHPATMSELQHRAQSVHFNQADGSVTVQYTQDTVRLVVGGDGRVEVTVTRRASGEEVASFREFDPVARHGSKPRSTRVMQSHHGLQDALMLDVFAPHYKSRDAPTLWLRDSTTGSPHRTITDTQVGYEGTRRAGTQQTGAQPTGTLPPTYAQIREWGIADLKAIGAPDDAIRAYVARMDKYFEDSVLPNIPEADRSRLVGTYDSLASEAP